VKIHRFILSVLIPFLLLSCSSKNEVRKITLEEFRSKMTAGWLGQMAGVGWGAPTEFKYSGMIIPREDVPVWDSSMINQQNQDDIYVEMTFLKTLEDHGFDVSIRQAGINFANSKYQLWHANYYGRENLRSGIAPPFSGHPDYNAHADDIDYQIEADYSGLISPGMPQMVIDLGNKFGRMMNYGDGLYGGQFVGAMYAEAFFETDIHKIISSGLACIPEDSQYAEAIRDVLKWYEENPSDWTKTWQLIENKYNLNHDYRKFSCSGADSKFNIDAKINGAYIVMGLLYGKGDMDETIIISMRCGQDSDCNPSNAAGILATSLGLENLPEKYKIGIDDTTHFSYTAYDFPSLINVCEQLALKAIKRAGGSVDKDEAGKDLLVIPVKNPVRNNLEQCWNPSEPESDIHFSKEEMDQITVKVRNAEDFIKNWEVAGPYSRQDAEVNDLFDIEFAPELKNQQIEWKVLPVDEGEYDKRIINLENIFGTEQCVAYLRTTLISPVSQTVIFEIGSDDGIKIWLNGQLAHQHNIVRGYSQGDDVCKVTLMEGNNDVLMKITQGIGGWAASLVVTDIDGQPLRLTSIN